MAAISPSAHVIADVITARWIRDVVLVGIYASLIAACAQISFYLPWNPAVPVTLQTFAVVLGAAALGAGRGFAGVVVYAMIGSLGAPIFSGGSSGFGGPTYGYIIGFVIAAAVVGRMSERGGTRSFLPMVSLMIIGNLIIYVVGVTWLKYSLSLPWFGDASAWAYGARDFIASDLIKIAVASGLLPLAWRALRRFGA